MSARLVAEKGVRLFLDTAELLLRSDQPMRFFLAGDGPLRDEVERRRRPGIAPLGKISHPLGVTEFLRAVDVFVCPSLTTPSWEDQGPRALLEAMMCGCIPVGTPTGAIPEMLDGQGVLAVDTGKWALADALIAAAAQAGDVRARSRVQASAYDRFSDRAAARQLIELWRTVAARDVGRGQRSRAR